MMNALTAPTELTVLLNEDSILVQPSAAVLAEKAVNRGEGVLTASGALCAETGTYTGRSPKDKFIVEEEATKEAIDWKANQPISEHVFDRLYQKVMAFLKEKEELFLFKGFAGTDADHQLPIQVLTEYAWHSLFARQLFVRPSEDELTAHDARFTILSAPSFHADPEVDGTHSEAFVIISFAKRTVLIGGTQYAGEMKKAIFSVMNFLLPERNVLPMHCSANKGADGRTALFFGLSGTGKTTLSADASRQLIGDDEHGWSEKGIFNIEGGCYAKTIGLTEENEPQIYRAIQFGSVLENVVLDPATRQPDYSDGSFTENTRAAYPIDAIQNSVASGTGRHPQTIIFLTADAFGVLPPISKLTKEQAMYHFLSGYTSKLAGTERGVTSPQTAFSACFGSPFLPLPATVYAEMLGDKIDAHKADVFLVNTGWTGGGYGTGSRMKLSYTRAMVQAAIEGRLTDVETHETSIFGLSIPLHIPGVPAEVLVPRRVWADEEAFMKQARELARKFQENFKKFQGVPADIEAKGGPRL